MVKTFCHGRAECPAVTLNGVAAEKGTYPLSALRTGENVLDKIKTATTISLVAAQVLCLVGWQ